MINYQHTVYSVSSRYADKCKSAIISEDFGGKPGPVLAIRVVNLGIKHVVELLDWDQRVFLNRRTFSDQGNKAIVTAGMYGLSISLKRNYGEDLWCILSFWGLSHPSYVSRERKRIYTDISKEYINNLIQGVKDLNESHGRFGDYVTYVDCFRDRDLYINNYNEDDLLGF